MTFPFLFISLSSQGLKGQRQWQWLGGGGTWWEKGAGWWSFSTRDSTWRPKTAFVFWFHDLNPDVTTSSWKRRQDFVGGGEVAAGLERTDRYKKKPTEK